MQSLVDYSRNRQAPEHVLAGLRAIDPTADLLWWGPRLVEQLGPNGRPQMAMVPVWFLGTVRSTFHRRRTGAEMLHTQEVLGPQGNRDSWRFAKLVYQGFAPVAFYPTREPHWGIVEDFRKRDWIFRCQFDAEGERVLDEAEGVPKLELARQTMREKVLGEAPGVWQFTFGGRRSFNVN